MFHKVALMLNFFQTGELVKVMTGNDLSSTDLHLAGGDSLLVGQVADIAPVEDNTLPATPPLTPRVLQVNLSVSCLS